MLAFLDQFVARGAAQDILDLRDRLANDPDARERRAARSPSGLASEREAFDLMVAFFEDEYETLNHAERPGGRPSLEELIGWMEWHPDASDPERDFTSDPAQWFDWPVLARGWLLADIDRRGREDPASYELPPESVRRSAQVAGQAQLEARELRSMLIWSPGTGSEGC